MSEDNLQLWDSVERTDPSYTKPYTGPGGFKGTAINALYTVRKATEKWGPIGKGWGYEVVEDRIDEGAPLFNKEGEVYPASSKVHTIRIKLWYIEGGEKCEVYHYGHTPFVYANKWGPQTEPEPAKKSLTDALTKCLSMLGFGADVFLGLYDDSGYVDEARELADMDKADDKAAKAVEQRQAYDDWMEGAIRLLETAVTMNELEKSFVAAIRKAKHKNDDPGQINLAKAKDKRKAELEAPK